MAGDLDHTFSSTGISANSETGGGKTLSISGTDAFTVNFEISRDNGTTWVVGETFAATAVKNLDWNGRDALCRFNCTAFTSADVVVSFK